MQHKINIEEYQKQLKSYLLQIAPNTNLIELDLLVKEFTLDEFPRKQKILSKGESSDTIYFITKGLVRIYYLKNNKEITNWIVNENMIFSGMYSVMLGEKNHSIYEALEDTYVLKIKTSTLESFYTKYHSIEHLGRKMIETYYGLFMKKTFDVLFLSADDRYTIFLKEHKKILKRLPLHVIASYLGIAQETLSRLRSKVNSVNA